MPPLRASPTFARFSAPPHLGVEPDRQRAPAFERIVIGGPVRRLVSRGSGFAHARQLPSWIHKVNPLRDLCNKAPANCRAKLMSSYVASCLIFYYVNIPSVIKFEMPAKLTESAVSVNVKSSSTPALKLLKML